MYFSAMPAASSSGRVHVYVQRPSTGVAARAPLAPAAPQRAGSVAAGVSARSSAIAACRRLVCG
jgi:hypothetical protein